VQTQEFEAAETGLNKLRKRSVNVAGYWIIVD